MGRSPLNSPVRAASPVRKASPRRPPSPSKQPFNFQLQDMGGLHGSSLVVKAAHRKGHRYKHSSVSMNLFQEPIPVADANQQPDLIPDLYPIPNARESWNSVNPSQKLKLMLSFTHFFTAMLVFVTGVRIHQPSFSTLAHLVFYDSLGSLVVAFVDVMSNFEVWSKPSIAYPFGLGRLEVLMGFALSTSLVMVGCDLVSHFVEEMVVSFVVPNSDDTTEHGAHHIHSSDLETTSWLFYELILILVMAVTWITSNYIFDHGSISDMMADTETKLVKSKILQGRDTGGLLSATGKRTPSQVKVVTSTLVKNPVRLLTMVYSFFLSLLPLVPALVKESVGFDLNEVSTLVVASTLCYAGWKLVNPLGGILLISFPYSTYDYNVMRATLTDKILALPSFKSSHTMDNLFVTKINYQLYVVGLNISMKGGSSDDESRVLFEVNRTIEQTIRGFESDSKVEITIDVDRI